MPGAPANLSRTVLRLGTRGSPLARWQAEWVADRLQALGRQVEIVCIETGGDRSSRPIPALGGQGLFTKEIQRALLDRRVDLAVHSLKDLPTEPVHGLVLAAVPPRDSPGDALVSPIASSLEALPQGARVGTGSRRRQSQLLHARPDLRVAELRGNVDTRLRKLDEGQYDAIVLAEAGLKRLGRAHRIAQIIPPEIMLPAAGQGALGIETRADDLRAREALLPLDDRATRQAVLAERAVLAELRGGCLAPIGMWARMEQGRLVLDAAVLSPAGDRRVAARAQGSPEDPQSLGAEVARQLLAQGAAQLIAEARA